jgi:hypothetical protein
MYLSKKDLRSEDYIFIQNLENTSYKIHISKAPLIRYYSNKISTTLKNYRPILVNSSSCTPKIAESLEVEETEIIPEQPTSASGITSESW